nr:MAG TPA: hypothetical protein [Caudoviricetes sp.]
MCLEAAVFCGGLPPFSRVFLRRKNRKKRRKALKNQAFPAFFSIYGSINW